MSLIGIEEHWTTPELKAALESLPPELRDDSLAFNERGDHLTRLEDVGDGRIAAMDEQGIDVQVLSVAPPANGPLPAADARRLARDLNDLAAEAVSRHPTRLLALATLPMADPQAVSGEVERASAAGFVGAMVYGRTGDVPLDDPRYDDLFSTAARLGRPLFIHPQIPTKEVRAAQYGGLGDLTGLALSTFAWGWHLEAATAALRLIASGAFDRHPELQIVLGHWGELLLFWLSRADGLSGLAGLDRTVSEYVRQNVHITASGMFEPALLRHASEVTTIDRLLFSTDYPFQHPTGDEVEAFLGEFATDADRDAFAGANAARLFGIDV
jgi:predicted TIM-barrel fold metal-dependent hydrolase